MKTATHSIVLAAAATALGAASASADVLPFNQIQTYETIGLGAQPPEFHDADTGWYGEVVVVESGVGGAPLAGPAGGSRFAQVTPDDEGSYDGNRNAPYAHLGAQQAYPISGDRYGFVVDIYTASTTNAMSFIWINGVNDSDDTGADDIVMTEAGFNFTAGESNWSVVSRPGNGPAFLLDVNTWYTFEVLFDRSGPEVTAIHNIYAQGSDTALYSVVTTPDDDRFSGTQGAPSTDIGGPRYSWFTNWNSDSVSPIYIDNMGTVPEPASLALAAAGGAMVLLRRRRNNA